MHLLTCDIKIIKMLLNNSYTANIDARRNLSIEKWVENGDLQESTYFLKTLYWL